MDKCLRAFYRYSVSNWWARHASRPPEASTSGETDRNTAHRNIYTVTGRHWRRGHGDAGRGRNVPGQARKALGVKASAEHGRRESTVQGTVGVKSLGPLPQELASSDRQQK